MATFDDDSLLSNCSSPLSSPASSPSPPPPDFSLLSYPSPPASQDSSDAGSPCPDGMDSKINVSSVDGPPRAKKRRISDRKERTTHYLDLTLDSIKDAEKPQLDKLLKVLHKRQKIVVVAGAGISVSAGIPDFRSSTGLFTSLKSEYNLKGSGKHLFDASVYKDDLSTSSFHDMVRNMSKLTKDAQPTGFHHMLATLAQDDRLLRLYTQNVDGIDTALVPLSTTIPLKKRDDGKWPKTVQLHGGLDNMVCSKCSSLKTFDADLFDGPVPPVCTACVAQDTVRTVFGQKRSHGVGRMRPRMVLYNEHNPDDEAIGKVVADDLRKRPDALIVVGTSMKIPGVRRIVREMCATVRDRRDGVTIWINNDPEPLGAEFKDCWDIVVRGACDEVAKNAGLRKWYESPESVELTSEQWEEAVKTENKVLINKTYKPVDSKTSFRTSIHPPEYSPMPPRTILHDRDSIDNDSIVVGAPPTPSKSARSTPLKKVTPVSAFDAMKQKKPAQGKKPSQAKQTKAAASKSKAAAKTTKSTKKQPPKATIRMTKITQTMTQSKSSAAAAGKDLKSPSKTGHKRSRSQMEDLAMQPVSPEDCRINSPTKANKSPYFDVDKSTMTRSRDTRMSISSLCSD